VTRCRVAFAAALLTLLSLVGIRVSAAAPAAPAHSYDHTAVQIHLEASSRGLSRTTTDLGAPGANDGARWTATQDGEAPPPSTFAAEGGSASLSAGDLSGDVLSNYNRFLKSLPSGAGDTTITQLPDGSYQFSSDVPATNIPGSYATYTKVVGPDGVTTTFYKTTIAPDGSVVSVKVKYP
jgi:hypothetical protein